MDGAFNLTGIDISETEKDANPANDPPLSPASTEASSVVSKEALMADKNYDRIVDNIKHMTGS